MFIIGDDHGKIADKTIFIKKNKKTKKIPSTNEGFVELWAGWEQLLVTSNEICAWPVFFFGIFLTRYHSSTIVGYMEVVLELNRPLKKRT